MMQVFRCMQNGLSQAAFTPNLLINALAAPCFECPRERQPSLSFEIGVEFVCTNSAIRKTKFSYSHALIIGALDIILFVI